ncbi:MAG: DUF695 domain-containing protein [Daejeonella sp.]|uniref:DUF695 domain-containing protein n=1 Tax=Daejeonella sp. TaxID=2805397 RepID=UPI003C7873A8
MRNIYFIVLFMLPLVSCSQTNTKETDTQKQLVLSKPEDTFTTLQFEFEGKPCVAVINKQYKDYKNKFMFPLSLFLKVNTLEKDKNEHPTEHEYLAFHELQTAIIRALSAEFTFCHVGATTMTGYRDIIFYINPKDQEKAVLVLNKFKADNKRFESYTFETDPEWEAVASFYEAVPANN